MTTIVLTDGKAGHENQSKAFAASLGDPFVLVHVRFRNAACKMLSYILDFFGVHAMSLLDFQTPPGAEPPAADGTQVEIERIVGTGSGTFYAMKTLAGKGRPRAKCAAVLYPRGYRLAGFDCILAPSFDNPAKRPNVVELPVNITAGDDAFYEAGVKAFRERHAPSGRRAVAVIVGGPNKCSTMPPEWMKRKLDEIFAQTEGCERWVTTSRRTPPETEAVVASYPWDYALIYSKDSFNPIPAFVSLADRLYVTAESTGMLSEACSRGGAEVFALDNLKPGRHKFRRFLESLERNGYVGGRRKADLRPCFDAAAKLLGQTRRRPSP